MKKYSFFFCFLIKHEKTERRYAIEIKKGFVLDIH